MWSSCAQNHWRHVFRRKAFRQLRSATILKGTDSRVKTRVSSCRKCHDVFKYLGALEERFGERLITRVLWLPVVFILFFFVANLFFVVFYSFCLFSFLFYWGSLGYFFGCDLISYGLILLSLWICVLIVLARESVFRSSYFSGGFFRFVVIILTIILYCTFESRLIPTLFFILGWHDYSLWSIRNIRV